MGLYSNNANVFTQNTPPDGAQTGWVWIDTSVSPPAAKVYDGSAWNKIITFASAAVVTHSSTEADYTSPSSGVSSSNGGTGSSANSDFSANTSNATNWVGDIRCRKITGLTPGATLDSISVDLAATGSGKIRVYAYDDSSNSPNNLLAESLDTTIAGTGVQAIALVAGGVVPSDGIVWVGFAVDTVATDIKYNGTYSGYKKTQAYGASPDPFAGVSDGAITGWWGRLTVTNPTLPADAVDDDEATTHWQSSAEANPNIYVDLASAKNVCGIALHKIAAMTETEVKIQTSLDASTWSDVRTITVSNITLEAWSYWRFNIKEARYIRVYGNSGSSLVLALNEIKILVKTDAEILADLGLLEIDATDTSLGGDGI